MTGKTVSENIQDGTLDFEGLVKSGGAFSTGKRYQPDELKDLLRSRINPIVGSSSTSSSSGYNPSEPHLVVIELPPEEGRNERIRYVTLMKDGKAMFTRDESGNLNLTGAYESSSETVMDLAYTAMFEKHKRRAPAGGGSKKGTQNRKAPIYTRHVIDPVLRRYIQDHGQALAHSAMVGDTTIGTGTIKGKENLEAILDDPTLVQRAATAGATLEVTPLATFLAVEMKGKISREVGKMYGRIKDMPQISKVAGSILREKYLVLEDPHQESLRKICQDPDAVLGLYAELMTKQDELNVECPEDPYDNWGEHYVIGFRELALEVMRDVHTVLKDTVPQEELDTERRMIIAATRHWIAAAKAADHGSRSHYMQGTVIPIIDDDSVLTDVKDRAFQAYSTLLQRVVDPQDDYDLLSFSIDSRAIYMTGKITRRPEKGEDGAQQRTMVGTLSEYTDGVGHLLKRYSLYDRLLTRSFRKLLSEGSFDGEELDLKKQANCSRFGHRLYDDLEHQAQTQFSRLRSDIPLKAGRGSSYMRRILRAYVAIKADYFLDEIQKRGEKNKEPTECT